MFNARAAHKRIEIYESIVVPDGYGGNTVDKQLKGVRWASVDDVGAKSYQNDAGITDFKNTYKFIFRYDRKFIMNPKTHTLKYNGSEFSIIDVKNIGFTKVNQAVIAKEIFI